MLEEDELELDDCDAGMTEVEEDPELNCESEPKLELEDVVTAVEVSEPGAEKEVVQSAHPVRLQSMSDSGLRSS